MEIMIDLESPEPLYAQLAGQIREAVQAEDILPGEPMKSIRELAEDLDMNSKTVAKAFHLLERDGIIQTRGYRGTFIHPDAVENCEADTAAWAREQIDDLVARLRAAGVTSTEIRAAFSQALVDQ